MKKTRGDSLIEKLPENQRAALERWLCDEHLTYAQARERLYSDFGVRCSESPLRGFFQRVMRRRVQERVTERVVTAAQTANAVTELAEQNPANFQRAMLEMVARIAMEKAVQSDQKLSVSELSDLCMMALAAPKEAREERKVVIKQEQLKLEERRVKVLELKAAQSDQARGVVESALTPEEQRQRLKQIFGMS